MICLSQVSARGSLIGRQNISDLIQVFKVKIDSHLTGTVIVSLKGRFTLHVSVPRNKLGQLRRKDALMSKIRIGYARCSTDKLDLAAQRAALVDLGVAEDRISTNRNWRCVGLRQARAGGSGDGTDQQLLRARHFVGRVCAFARSGIAPSLMGLFSRARILTRVRAHFQSGRPNQLVIFANVSPTQIR